MATVFHNATIRTACMNAVVTEAGSGAIGRLYDGTRPAAGGTLSGNTLIAEVTFDTTLGSVTSGVLTVGTITGDTSANNSGTPTFIRIFKSDGTTIVADYPTSGFPACTAGQSVDITGMTLTDGNVG